ncbi:MAG: hypothetical protein NXI24_19650 [bacterium]|nr:hypothetical protein [bacterium]
MSDSDDHASIDLNQDLDPELETVFAGICATVRKDIDERRRAARISATGGALAPNYAAALLQSIQDRYNAGQLDRRGFDYCLAAAGEIFELEMIFFDSQFSTMLTGADPQAETQAETAREGE